MKSKLAIIIYIILALIILASGYFLYKKQNNKTSPTTEQTKSSDSTTTTQSDIDDLTVDNDADNGETDQTDNQSDVDNSSPTDSSAHTDAVSPTKTVTGSTLAHITPEHCDSNCQAFAIDLKLFEYCEQACGISPIKDVSDCDGKKDIQKDYCLKDMAINDEDPTVCDQISDANIKQSCQNRIQQDFIENQQ